MVNMEEILLLLVVFTHLLSSCLGQVAVAGIGCFECHSVDGNVRDCEDPFKPHNETEHLYSRRCVVGYLRFQAYHCVKIKGKREDNGQSIVIRTCSVEDWGSTCGDIYFEHDETNEPIKLNGCLESCHLDGCNTASRTLLSGLSTVLVVLIAIYTGLCS